MESEGEGGRETGRENEVERKGEREREREKEREREIFFQSHLKLLTLVILNTKIFEKCFIT
jgi:hypothetical protein